MIIASLCGSGYVQALGVKQLVRAGVSAQAYSPVVPGCLRIHLGEVVKLLLVDGEWHLCYVPALEVSARRNGVGASIAGDVVVKGEIGG